jgi:Rieske Fe-S protein
MLDPDPTMTDPAPAAVGRRVVVLGAGAVGVAGVLAACGGGDDDTASDGGATTEAAPPPTETEPAPAETTQAPPPGGATGIVAVVDVPVGGGVVIAAEQVVVTQPTEGEFKAFGSTCTHQGCQVSEVSNGEITCFCHGSRYSIDDGSVTNGPAPEPLPEVGIAVEGDQVVLT